VREERNEEKFQKEMEIFQRGRENGLVILLLAERAR
jgi:hypothetical protein